MGYLRKDRMNWRWVIEEEQSLRHVHTNMYNGRFSLQRKKKLFDYLVSQPNVCGRFSKEEDCFISKNYHQMTRLEMAMELDRKPHSVKNRMRKLKIRKGV